MATRGTAPVRLGDVAIFVNGDRSANYPKAADYVSDGIPFISASDIKGGRLDLAGVSRISVEAFERLRDGKIKNQDILFCLRGSIGKTARALGIERGAIASSLVIVRPREQVDGDFLSYFLVGPAAQSIALSLNNGSAQPNLSVRSLANIGIPLPSLDQQRRIASVLRGLDDKIDLNRRMNETLEAMARATFKDWFIDFGPTRAKMEGSTPYLAPEIWSLFPDRVDEEGKPEGWTNSTVRAEFRLTMGQSPPGDTYNNAGDGLPFFQGRTDFGERYPKRRMYCTAPTRFAEADDTLVSVRAPVGDLNMAWERCCVGRGVAAVRHLSGARGYTYYALNALQPDLAAFEHTGTVFGAISKVQFELLNILAPGVELIETFEQFVSSLDDRVRSNLAETQSLVSVRDLLLPKLMSGKVCVKDAEKIVVEAL